MRLVIPDGVWSQLLDELSRQPPHVERIAYLDGHDDGHGVGVVTTVVIPNADCQPGHYTVNADAMSEAGAHFRIYGLVRLAQVHTHGGTDTSHSCRDDRLAFSQHSGALSIVLPRHAADRPAPNDGRLHVRRPEGWMVLDLGDSIDRITVVPSILDFRRAECLSSLTDTKAPSEAAWRRLIRRIRSAFS